MTIKKFTGKTQEEAKAKAREALGSDVVIMNIKEVKPRGIAGIFKSPTYEVTAAIEDAGGKEKKEFNMKAAQSVPLKTTSASSATSTFEAVADDAIILKNAFSAVNKVLEKQGENKGQATYQPPKMSQPTMSTQTPADNFVPLSEEVPHAHIIEPTYSKPKGARFVKSEELSSHTSEKAESVSVSDKTVAKAAIDNENHVFVKMLYNVLLENEVQEKYINQVLEDMDKVLQTSHSLDNLLSSVYQKMVLKLGAPSPITNGTRKPKVIFFIGPTGVGKTTTIAKIASKFKVEEGKKVGLITADTFRMAAANQLQTYANILGVPLNVIYSADELLDTVKKQTRENEDLDFILVDTIGFSHKNEKQREDTAGLISVLNDYYDTDVYLVLSATTKEKDLCDIADSYMLFTKFNLIFTKLDETKSIGNIFNIKLYTGAPLSYVTAGQNVPDDIEVVNAQKLVKQLLGGN